MPDTENETRVRQQARHDAPIQAEEAQMTENLTLPAEFSQVWDWAHRLSEHTQRLDRIRKLRATLAKLGRECGDCHKWNKSRECPKEHNVKGHSRGPSWGEPICGAYAERPDVTARRPKLQAELDAELADV